MGERLTGDGSFYLKNPAETSKFPGNPSEFVFVQIVFMQARTRLLQDNGSLAPAQTPIP